MVIVSDGTADTDGCYVIPEYEYPGLIKVGLFYNTCCVCVCVCACVRACVCVCVQQESIIIHNVLLHNDCSVRIFYL